MGLSPLPSPQPLYHGTPGRKPAPNGTTPGAYDPQTGDVLKDSLHHTAPPIEVRLRVIMKVRRCRSWFPTCLPHSGTRRNRKPGRQQG